MKTVVLGLSGGVDSSVAALLLKNQGYKVIGVFMKNYSDSKDKITGDCLWIEEKRMAQKISVILDIPLITVDYEKQYKKLVIDKMIKDYSLGITPNPDVSCNTIIKFPALWKVARKLKADYIATGHYVRVKKNIGKFCLFRGKDENKDQSYFLYELTERDLSHSIFPIGELTKGEVRDIAKKNNFPNWRKKGTKGICFIGKMDMKKFLKKKIKEKKGNVIYHDGRKIGEHPGITFFTIGERIGEGKGIYIDKEFNGKKLYVAKKMKNNEIIVVEKNHPLLKRKKIIIKKFHVINKIVKRGLKGRIRHLGELHSGKLIKKGNKWIFKFVKGVNDVANGQSIVLYKGKKVIGGGEIR